VPDKGFGLVVPGCDPVVEISGEFFDVVVGGALQHFAGEFREPAFDEVEP
jgi:hypothetical protein